MSDDPKSTPNLTVMLGQPDATARMVLEAMAGRIGYDVTLSTGSATELMDRCRQQPPNVVIVDHRLAGGDGAEVVNQIGQHSIAAAVLLVPPDGLERAKRDSQNSLAGMLVLPVTASQLRPSVFIAHRRFELAQRLASRAKDLRDQLVGDGQFGSGQFGDGQFGDGLTPPRPTDVSSTIQPPLGVHLHDHPLDDHQDKDS